MRINAHIAPINQHQDPAWRRRVVVAIVALSLLLPMLVLSEFKPWTLLDAQSLSATGRFLASFVPPAHSLAFLKVLAGATWETVAMATVGMTLAMLAAIPM